MHFWPNNSAKSRIIDEILAHHPASVTIMDYGAGKGGDWPTVLATHSRIRLICYEPHPPSASKLSERLKYLNAKVIGRQELESSNLNCDVIVSFSVLEHVRDRAAYLRNAARHLASNGVFYLNYDDGHFRSILDLNKPQTWVPALKTLLVYRLAKLRWILGQKHHFIAPVDYQDLDKTLKAIGLEITSSRFENIQSLKAFSNKLKSTEDREEFCQTWTKLEQAINDRFMVSRTGEYDSPLWELMASRTLKIKKS